MRREIILLVKYSTSKGEPIPPRAVGAISMGAIWKHSIYFGSISVTLETVSRSEALKPKLLHNGDPSPTPNRPYPAP